MKIRRFLKRELLQILILGLPFVLAAVWWNKIPPVVATHWDVHDQPIRWASRVPGLLLPPTINVVLCLALAFLPWMDPRVRGNPTFDTARYRRILRVYRYAISTLIAEIATAIIARAAGWRVDIELIAVNGMLALFLVVGNFLGGVAPSSWVGIRTPWTVRDNETWRAVHGITGRLMVFGALTLLAAEFFVSRSMEVSLLKAFGVGLAVWSLGYSAWFFQRRRLA